MPLVSVLCEYLLVYSLTFQAIKFLGDNGLIIAPLKREMFGLVTAYGHPLLKLMALDSCVQGDMSLVSFPTHSPSLKQIHHHYRSSLAVSVLHRPFRVGTAPCVLPYVHLPWDERLCVQCPTCFVARSPLCHVCAQTPRTWRCWSLAATRWTKCAPSWNGGWSAPVRPILALLHASPSAHVCACRTRSILVLPQAVGAAGFPRGACKPLVTVTCASPVSTCSQMTPQFTCAHLTAGLSVGNVARFAAAAAGLESTPTACTGLALAESLEYPGAYCFVRSRPPQPLRAWTPPLSMDAEDGPRVDWAASVSPPEFALPLLPPARSHSAAAVDFVAVPAADPVPSSSSSEGSNMAGARASWVSAPEFFATAAPLPTSGTPPNRPSSGGTGATSSRRSTLSDESDVVSDLRDVLASVASSRGACPSPTVKRLFQVLGLINRSTFGQQGDEGNQCKRIIFLFVSSQTF